MSQATADFEAGVATNPVLVADAGSATAWDVRANAGGGNSITYDATHSYGALAAKVDSTGTVGADNQLVWTTGIGTLTDWYGRLYLYATAFPVGSFRPVRDSNNNFVVFITSTGEVQQYDQGGFIHQTDAAIALNQWVRIEWRWLNSATVGQAEVKLFNNPDSATATETKTSAANRNTSVSTTEIGFGLASGVSEGGPIWLDNLVAGATSYPGPVAVPSTEPQVLSMLPHISGHGVW